MCIDIEILGPIYPHGPRITDSPRPRVTITHTITVEGEESSAPGVLAGILWNIPHSGGMRYQTPASDGGESAREEHISHPVVTMDDAVARWRDELSARCKPRSIDRMTTAVEQAAAFAGWTAVPHVDYSSATSFLSARRRGGWSGATYDQTVSVLRVFGDFLRKSGLATANPLHDLTSLGEPRNDGSRALTVAEARALIIASINRHLDSRRAKGAAPIYWLTLAYTGLRYAEGEAALWGDIDLEDAIPAIHTRPEWTGNKSGRRDIIPLCPHLLPHLLDYRETVKHAPTDPVFPIVPNRQSFRKDIALAGIKPMDIRQRPATCHSLRKSFATWLDEAGVPAGMRSMLTRHAQTLTERTYTDHKMSLLAEAVGKLPPIWPEGMKIFCGKQKRTVDRSENSRYVASAIPESTMKFNTPAQSSCPEMPSSVSGIATRSQEPGRLDSVDAQNPVVSGSCARSGPEMPKGDPDFRSQSTTRLEDEVALTLTRWLRRRLDSRGSSGACP